MKKEQLDNFKQLANTLSKMRGSLDFFALVSENTGDDSLDLVISAPWIKGKKRNAIKTISNLLNWKLGNEDKLIERIILLGSENPVSVQFQALFDSKKGEKNAWKIFTNAEIQENKISSIFLLKPELNEHRAGEAGAEVRLMMKRSNASPDSYLTKIVGVKRSEIDAHRTSKQPAGGTIKKKARQIR